MGYNKKVYPNIHIENHLIVGNIDPDASAQEGMIIWDGVNFLGYVGTAGWVPLENNWSASIDSDLIPDTDAIYNIGSSSFKFNDLFLSGNINISGQIEFGTSSINLVNTNNAGNVLIGKSTESTISDNKSSIHIGALAGANADYTGTIAIGKGSLDGNLGGGDYNIGVGYEAGANITNATKGIFIGYQAGKDSTLSTFPIFIGELAGQYVDGVDNIAIGRTSMTGNVGTPLTGGGNISMGYQSAFSLEGASTYNLMFGYHSGYASDTVSYSILMGYKTGYNVSGDNNVALGYRSMYGGTGTNIGTYNVAIGYDTLFSITGGDNIIALGQNAGYSLTTGDNNVLLGYKAGYYIETSSDNIGIGQNALLGVSGTPLTGGNNIVIGKEAGKVLQGGGANNVYIGSYTGSSNLTGTGNMFLGNSAGYASIGTDNVFLGTLSGTAVVAGINNVFIGTGTGGSITEGSSNVIIGYGAGTTGTFSNRLYIHNSATATPMIYGEFDNNYLKINDHLEIEEEIKIGSYTGGSPTEGMIQWTGTNFQGYTGTAGWINLDLNDMNWSDLVDSDLIPDTNDTYDIGSTGSRFKDLYLSDNFDVDGTGDIALTLNVGGNITTSDTFIGDHIIITEEIALGSYTGGSPTEGMIQWTGTNFMGYIGTTGWINLDVGGDGTLEIDTINEFTLNTGVTVEGILIKDTQMGIGITPSFDLHVDGTIAIEDSAGADFEMYINGSNVILDYRHSLQLVSNLYGNALNLYKDEYVSPGQDNVIELGRSIARWKNLYVGTNVYIDGNILVDTINEKTISAGIIVDGVLLKNSNVVLGAYEQITGENPFEGMIQWTGTNFLGYTGTAGWINLDGVGATDWSDLVNSTLNPDTDDNYDLGNNSEKFKDLYLSGISYSDRSIITEEISIGSYSGGSPEEGMLQWTGTNFQGYTGTAGWINLDFSDMDWSDPVDSNIVPDTTNTYDIGSGTYKFKDIYNEGFIDVGGDIIKFSGSDFIKLKNTSSISIGTNAGLYNNATKNLAIGEDAMKGIIGTPITGYGSIAIGHSAGLKMQGNVNWNVIVGLEAGKELTTGDSNTFLGVWAGSANVIGSGNVYIGNSTGWGATGSDSVLIGTLAGGASSANDNVIIGSGSGSGLTTGTLNTMIGYGTGKLISTGSGNVILGPISDQGGNFSNRLYISNADTPTPLIYGEFDNFLVKINARLEVTEEIIIGNTITDTESSAGMIRFTGNTFEGYDGSIWIRLDNADIWSQGISSDMIPNVDNAYDIGSSTYAFKDIYLGSGGSIFIDQGGSVELGFTIDTNNNILIGKDAGTNMVDDNYNIAIGNNAAANIADFIDDSIHIGRESGQNTQSAGTFIGSYTGRYQQGNKNTAIGLSALEGIVGTLGTGDGNTVLGYRAGYSVQGASNNNTLIGSEAGYSITMGDSNLFIGYQAGYSETASNKLYIANSNTTTPLIYGDFDNNLLVINNHLEVVEEIKIGIYTGGSSVEGMIQWTGSNFQGYVGTAGWVNLDTYWSDFVDSHLIPDTTNQYNIGSDTYRFKDIYNEGFVDIGGDLIKFSNVNFIKAVGTGNVFMGFDAGNSINTGSENTGIGTGALNLLTDGNENMALGKNALSKVTTGNYNVAMGRHALRDTTGSNNVGVGYRAGEFGSVSTNNTFIGLDAGRYKTTGNSNVCIGNYTGMGVNGSTTYENNVLIGHSAGTALETGSDNIFIGYYAGANETGSNKLYIENTNSSSPLIYGEFDNDLVQINGDLIVTGDYTVQGTLTTVDTENLLIKDNLIEINYGMTGTPSINLQSGIKVNRGDEDPYVFIFDETADTFRIGAAVQQTDGTFIDTDLQAVATREDNPTSNAFGFWNDTDKKFDTSSRLVDAGTSISLGADLIPDTNDTYDIGSSSYQWQNIYSNTAILSNLTDGYIPYHQNDTAGFINSPIFTNGTKVGIGREDPDELLHIYEGDFGGVSAHAWSALVIEDDYHTGINILTPSNRKAFLYFGDEDSTSVGGLEYDHANQQMEIIVGGSSKITILEAGAVDIPNSVTIGVNLDVGGDIYTDTIYEKTPGNGITMNRLTVTEEIKIGAYEEVTGESPTEGMIKWDGTNFQGYTGTDWNIFDKTFQNGLTESGGAVDLGGTFTGNVTFNNESNNDKMDWNFNDAPWDYYSAFELNKNGLELNTFDDATNFATTITSKTSVASGISRISASYINTHLSIELHTTNGMIIVDSIFSKGLFYSADYSTNFTDRSLIDKGYLTSGLLDPVFGTVTLGDLSTGVVETEGMIRWDGTNFQGYTGSAGWVDLDSQGQTYTFSNGLTESGGAVKLGGSFDENISIESINNKQVYIRADAFQGAAEWNKTAEFTFNSSLVSFDSWDVSGNNTATAIRSQIISNTNAQIYIAAATGSNEINIQITSLTGFEVTDEIFTKGIVYAADYSTNFTDRSLIDKGYLTSGLLDPSFGTVTLGDLSTGIVETEGMIRWDGINFQGYTGSAGWVDLDTQGQTYTFGNGLELNGSTVAILNDDLTNSIEWNGIGKQIQFSFRDSDSWNQYTYSKFSSSGFDHNAFDDQNGPYTHFKSETSAGNAITVLTVDNGGDYMGLEMASNTNAIWIDEINSRGLEYAANYSINFTDRSLIDKGYLTSGLLDAVFGTVTLGDVTTSTVESEGMIRWDGTNFTGYDGSDWIKFDLDGIDVSLTSIGEGDLLAYDSVTGKFVNVSQDEYTETERINQTNISADGQLTVYIKAGYIIDSLVIIETSGNNAGDISVGISSGTDEIISGSIINSNADIMIPIGQQYFSSTSNQDLYISSTNWGSGIVSIYMITKRII